LHPWHEVIPPSLTVNLQINDFIMIRDMPLFRIAQPLKRSADSDLEKRLAKIEEAMQIKNTIPSSNKLAQIQVINQNHTITSRINGPADDLGPLMEMTKHFLLSLRGLRRNSVLR